VRRVNSAAGGGASKLDLSLAMIFSRFACFFLFRLQVCLVRRLFLLQIIWRGGIEFVLLRRHGRRISRGFEKASMSPVVAPSPPVGSFRLVQIHHI